MNRIHRAARKASFQETMEETTRTMSVQQRTFSKIIHSSAISFTSDLIGMVVARPNALLTGAILSFIFTLSSYLLAKNLGYSLSGFESIGSFTIGWMLGLLYDFIKAAISGKS